VKFLMEYIIGVIPDLIQGIKVTFLITIVGVLIGFVIGTFVGIGRLANNKFISWICIIYIEIIRSTSILVHILFINFEITNLFSIKLDKLTEYIIANTINAAAYIAEIVRGNIQYIHKGKTEAGRTLGITHVQTMRYIVWPHAFKRI